MATLKIKLNAVAFREADMWIIQGIEYDIVAHAEDVAMLPDAFTRAIMENICITNHLGREPLEGVPAAPQRFVEMHAQSAVEMRPTAAHMDKPEVAIRLAA